MQRKGCKTLREKKNRRGEIYPKFEKRIPRCRERRSRGSGADVPPSCSPCDSHLQTLKASQIPERAYNLVLLLKIDDC